MEKLLKRFSLLFCMLMLTVAFTSCGDDDDEPETSEAAIIGTWGISYHDEYDGNVVESFTFNADGTGVNSYISEKNPDENFTVLLQWKLEGNTLTIWGDDLEGTATRVVLRVEITNDTLIMTVISAPDGEAGDVIVLNRM